MKAASDPMLPSLYQVDFVQRETDDTVTLRLSPKKGARPLLPFRPGQFNMLYVFGKGEVPISISGDPKDSRSLLHTARAVGTVSGAVEKLKRGDSLGVRGPFGSSWPIKEAEGKDLLIAAGGIGLAPLRPVIYEAIRNRTKFGRVVLFYGARTPQEMLYRSELARWSARFDLEVHVTVDRAGGGQTSSLAAVLPSRHTGGGTVAKWTGNVGVVTTLIPRVAFDPSRTLAMVCGPEVMMRFTIDALFKRGLARESLYLSMERNMKCGVAFCGHCQYGPAFICKDGPVFRFDKIQGIFGKREV